MKASIHPMNPMRAGVHDSVLVVVVRIVVDAVDTADAVDAVCVIALQLL